MTLVKYLSASPILVLLLLGENSSNSLIILRTWLFPFLGGIKSSITSEKRIIPTMSLFWSAENARVADISVIISFLLMKLNYLYLLKKVKAMS